MSNHNETNPNTVSVILPTFRRADGLQTALESLLAQNVSGYEVEIIIADNDPDASARDYVSSVIPNAKMVIHYIHVPNPGVSNARNAALEKASGRYLAFLDDDQEAGENWLMTLLGCAQTYKAGLCFVPTLARIPGSSLYHDYLYRFFSRFGPDGKTDVSAPYEGVIDDFFGCGNSLLDTHLCALPTPPFSTDMNETGGEDDLLFSELQNQGIHIAWSNKTCAYEDIRPHRATAEYVKVRSFAFGQGPSQLAAQAHKPLHVLKWMMVGAVQYLLYRPLSLILRITKRPSYIRYVAKAYEGAGKFLWFGGFTPKLYGAAVVENKAF
jgi:succinoglycan biosynthesis protein ExoM